MNEKSNSINVSKALETVKKYVDKQNMALSYAKYVEGPKKCP
jgi:hypothetical protein